MFRHACKNKKVTDILNHSYMWEIALRKPFPFCMYVYVSYISVLFGCLKATKCVVFCNFKNERENKRVVSRVSPSAVVGAARLRLGLLEGQADLLKGSGAPVLLSL